MAAGTPAENPEQNQQVTQKTEAEAATEKYAEEVANLRRELEREQLARQQAEQQARVAPEPAKPPKKTREELQALVDAGTITEPAMLDILNQQRLDERLEQVEQRLVDRHQQLTINQRLQEEIAAYKKNVPEIGQAGSSERARLIEEYDRLRNLGYPEGQSTEALACRVVFGPPERIQEKTRKEVQAHEETGGPSEGPATKKDAGAQIPVRLRDHYQKQIDGGYYKGWDDPVLKKEIKIAERAV